MTCCLLIAGLFIGVAFPGDTFAAKHRDYQHGKDIETSHPDWMSWIPDDTNLAQLSIPGTHDTLAFYGPDWTKTQSVRLPDQFQAGIRALDIRARHIDDRFAIHHGRDYQKANFSDVLRDTGEFLKNHPSETVLMRVQEEHKPSNNSRSFAETFQWYLDHDSNGEYIWVPPDSYDNKKLPDLKEVRGKIVILQNFDGEGKTYGLDWGSLGENLQDDYKVPTVFHIKKKWEKAKTHFQKTKDGDENQPYINFLSGSSAGAYPYTVAGGTGADKGVNKHALEYLFKDEDQIKRTGIVMMDFPGAGLLDVILARNFQLADSQADLKNDFEQTFSNLAYSADGKGDKKAMERAEQLHGFLNQYLSQQKWQVLVSKAGGDSWGYHIWHNGMIKHSDEIEGYVHLAFNSNPSDLGDVDSDELDKYVDGQLKELSGNAHERANQLFDQVNDEFPCQRWNVMVKKEPGGFENWAMIYLGDLHKKNNDGYIYNVWSNQGSGAEGCSTD